MHFIDIFFGGLIKTIYFRTVKHKQIQKNNPKYPNQ